MLALPYREIALVDFEFIAHPGERPEPVCLVVKLLRAGRTIRLWRDQFGPAPPYPVDAGTLFVAYYASAELGCHLKGFPAEVNRGFPRADRGRILCALIRREVGHARNVSQ
jgi:DNA polymerase-1